MMAHDNVNLDIFEDFCNSVQLYFYICIYNFQRHGSVFLIFQFYEFFTVMLLILIFLSLPRMHAKIVKVYLTTVSRLKNYDNTFVHCISKSSILPIFFWKYKITLVVL